MKEVGQLALHRSRHQSLQFAFRVLDPIPVHLRNQWPGL